MNTAWPQTIAIVIPSYKAVDSLKSFLPDLLEKVPAENICVVDDASDDGTNAICKEQRITCIVHEKNRGKGAALQSGFTHFLSLNYSWIITLDADGQHAITDLDKLHSATLQQPRPGIIIGNRSKRLGTMPPARIFSNRLTSAILSLLCGCRISDSQCGYRIYAAEFLRTITIQYSRFEMESEVILKACAAKFPVVFVPVQTLYLNRQSHISHLSDTMRWITAVIRVYREIRKQPCNT